MRVLDHGEVELVQSSASDLTVVAAARVSHGVVAAAASKGEEADQKLIRFLLKHNHGTPFEHNLFTFRVKAPIFVVREWHRHRVGWSYNEVSGRYTELEEEFYVPDKIRIPAPTNRQGSVLADWDPQKEADVLDYLRIACEFSFEEYRQLLEWGVAREMARMVLPLNTYTSFYASCNARSLMHFLTLRQAEDAQWEIREYADALALLFAETMPVTAYEFQRLSATTRWVRKQLSAAAAALDTEASTPSGDETTLVPST